MSSVPESKTQMRKDIIARRNSMDEALREEKSEIVSVRVLEDLEAALGKRCRRPFLVALFSSFGSEVSLKRLEQGLLAKGCKVCYPGMVKSDSASRPQMMFFEVGSDQVKKKTLDFLTKPARAFPLEDIVAQGVRLVDNRDIDFAVIPLVAFDGNGARLGYGGGNYDVFLQDLRADVPAIGVAFEEQRVDCIPREPHDIALKEIRSA